MITLLEEPSFGASSTAHPLGRIWRLLLRQMHMSVQEYLVKQSNWQTKLAQKIGASKALQMKSNTNDALAQKEISWNTLCRGIGLLNFSHFTIRLECYRNINDTKPLVVELTVDKLNDIPDDTVN
jgi:hypothetical protein